MSYYNDSDDYDDDYGSPPPPPPTFKQRMRTRYRKAEPHLPWLSAIPLAVGIGTRSTLWVGVSIFALLATKPANKYVTVSSCSFTSQGGAPGLMVR